ncbi:hypothetical protein OG462_20900 [Streptomyces sp. NBC_01077]|uniref:hypothetical protein n=1 Tax=Streptomyces sp. NBC_01077 TaxID=2903746 RepID=UPI003863C30A|nr:hypothetical protein OG462_20900 [Streptomyces sp. NBC_01077]
MSEAPGKDAGEADSVENGAAAENGDSAAKDAGVGSGADVENGDGVESGAPDERDDLSGQRMVNIEPGPGEGDGDDELALRRLFQSTVSGLEPSLGSLEHLRRAVPARRARKRQAVVGAAAAAVLIGTAVPAFVHVAASGGISAANPVNAGHGEEAQGGTGAETGVEGGKSATTPASTLAPSQGAADGSSGKPQRPGSGASATGPREAQNVPPGSVPACGAEQLGVSSAGAGAPDGEGKVHGIFRIANVSDRACVVNGSGIVGFEAHGAADPARISVIRHTSGDAGSGLPDPSQEYSSLLLKPSDTYELKFVWVPSETCPTTTTSPTPTEPTPTEPPTTPPPTDTPTEATGNPDPSGGTGSGGSGTEPGTGAEAGAGSGVAPQLLHEDGGPADGSVLVSHVAEPGGPYASASIPNACAGTIYRTGVLGSS